MTVQLRGAEAGQADRFHHALGGFVAEHAHGQHVLGEPFRDVARQLDRNLTG